MANVWAVANGNWSATATWSGSIKPVAGDDVYSNNFTVNVDESFDVGSLRNAASASAIVAGGTFNFNSGSISGSVTGATPLSFGASNLLTFAHITGDVTMSLSNNIAGTIGLTGITHSGNGNVTFTCPSIIITSNTNGSIFFSKTGAGTLTLNANLALTNVGQQNINVLNSSNGNVIVNGNISLTTPINQTTATIRQSVGNLTITGNITPASSFGSSAPTVSFSGTTLTINGNLVTGVGANVSSTGTTIINGDVNGTTNASGFGLSTSGVTTINGNLFGNVGATVLSSNTLTVNGNVNALSSFSPIASSVANTITVNGNVSASSTAWAIACSNVGAVLILSGSLYNTNGRQAAYVPNILVNQSLPMVAQFFSSTGQNITMYSDDTLANYPSASNVRQGTVYGVANGSVGTLAIPNATDVRNGVIYDATTTGSGLFTTALLLSEISSSSEPIAARIRNAGTVEVLGKLLESFRK